MKRAWRWIRRILIGLFAILMLPVLVLFFVLYTPWGTRIAVTRGLQFYDDGIPAEITLGRVEGILGGEVRLEALRFVAADGEPLVEIERARLELAPWAAVRKTLQVDMLEVDGLALHLWPTPEPWQSFSKPQTEPAPAEEDAPPGPDLPLAIVGRLAVAHFTVWKHADDGASTLTRDTALFADLRAEGRTAEVHIADGAGWVGPQELALAGLRADVAWDSPVLEVHHLEAMTSMAWLNDLKARFDVDAGAWTAAIELAASTPAQPPQPGLVARARVDGVGTLEHAHAAIDLAVPGLVATRISSVVRFADALEVALSGVGTLESAALPPVLRPLDETPFSLLGGARVEDGVEASVVLLSPDLVVVVGMDPRGAGEHVVHEASARVFVPGLTVAAEAELAQWKPRDVRATVAASSLAQTYAAVQQWITLPSGAPDSVDGTLLAHAACDLRQPARPRCKLDADGRGLAALDQTLDRLMIEVEGDPEDLDAFVEVHRRADFVRVRGHVARAEGTTRIDLGTLESRVQRQTVVLRRPARIEIAPEGIDVRNFVLAAARGEIAAEGRVRWAGRSNASLDLHALDLSLVQQYVPAIALAGRLDGNIELEGDARAPQLRAEIELRDLHYRDEALGTFAVRANYANDEAAAELRWDDTTEHIAISARAPLRADLERKKIEPLKRQKTVTANIDISNVRLKRLQPWIGVELDGMVDLDVVADGSIDDPRVMLSGGARGLEVDTLAVGEVALQGLLEDERASVKVQVAGRPIERLELDASIPVPPRPELDQEVTVSLHRADLATLERWLPDLQARGLVGGTITARHRGDETFAEVSLQGLGLALRGEDLGRVEIDARLDASELVARVMARGAHLRALNLNASVPLVLAGTYGPIRPRDDVPVEAQLAIDELDLQAFSRWTGSVGLGGSLGAELAVAGTLAVPEVQLRVATEGLAVDTHAIGRLQVTGNYADERVEVALEHAKAPASLSADVSVPIRIRPLAGEFAWKPEDDHRARIVAKGIDREILAAAAELPREWEPKISADIDLSGRLGAMRGRGKVQAAFAIPDQRDTPVAVMFDLEENRQKARVLIGAFGPASLQVDAETDIVLASLMDGSFDPERVTLAAQVRSQGFPMRALAPLTPPQVHEPSGKLNVMAGAQGPLSHPEVRGTLSIDEGALTVVPLNQRFRDLTLQARFDGPDVVLERLSFDSGDGSANLQGRMHVARGDTWGEMKLAMKRLPVVRPGLPLLRIDSDIQARLDARGERTEVTIVSHKTFVDILEQKLLANPEKIPTFDRVELVDRAGARDAEKAAQEKGEPWLPTDMRLSMKLDQPVLIRGAQTEMMWGGAIEVTRGADDVHIEGGFRSQGGYFELLNHEFTLTEGSVEMPAEGEIDPYIDVTADTTIGDYDVSVRISGRATRPELKLSANPPLPQDQVFALLVTGRPDAGAGESKDVATKAASLLASFQNPALQQQLRDQIGIDRVGIGFGDSVDEPILTVGKRLSRKLYLETTYHVNADVERENRAEARVEYRFKPPAWSLETVFGTEGIGRLGLWWQKSFGGAKRANRAEASNRKQGGR